jgi:glucose/arabinose dehydrogenase
LVTSDFSASPVNSAVAPGDSRLFILERPGRIRIIQAGRLLPTPFLDISSKVSTEGDQGMMSMAFHPDFARNHYFYVYYNQAGTSMGTQVVARFTARTDDPNRADPASEHTILTAPPLARTQNGAELVFGPDGMLYLATGDNNREGQTSQVLSNLLGKLIRIDVDGADPYAIPTDNPYAGGGTLCGQAATGAQCAEIWATGLRNPYRVAFDNGLIYIADVGGSRYEEVNVEPANRAGLNYGWPIMEGRSCWPALTTTCDQTGLTLPAFQYSHSEGCAVIGGYVYRGGAIPEVRGKYFYTDFCSGWLRSLTYNAGAVSDMTEWISATGYTFSLAQDSAGELYLLTSPGPNKPVLGNAVYRVVRQ